MSPRRYPLTVIILTLNEEINIAACLETVEWADDVLIVDSGSQDGTQAMALRTRKDVRWFEHEFVDFGDQRNWALDHTSPRHPWVLFLDADERCTPACAAEMKEAMTHDEGHAGYYLSCRNFFLDRWIRHCTLYPSWQLRLLKSGSVRYRKEGHGQREVTEGTLGYITEPYDHYGFSKGIDEWLHRHDTYSSNEVELILRLRRESLDWKALFGGAAVARRRLLKQLAARTGWRPLFRFLYIYVIRRGFLDGKAGWAFCRLRVAHEIQITRKLADARQS